MNSYLKIALCLISCLVILRSSAQDLDPDSFRTALFKNGIVRYGGLERADTTVKNIYLVFTGGDYNEGGRRVMRVLKNKGVRAHFFFTGDFYRAADNKLLIKGLKRHGHYLGAHSDKHLLYAAWSNRDSLLVTREEFSTDLLKNYKAMADYGISKDEALLFMPPYEWYNRQISKWTAELGLVLINFTPGTRSNADYTTPDMGDRYISSAQIYRNILDYESTSSCGLNGFILLIHIGTHPDRTDKLYNKLPQLIDTLRARGYHFDLLSRHLFTGEK